MTAIGTMGPESNTAMTAYEFSKRWTIETIEYPRDSSVGNARWSPFTCWDGSVEIRSLRKCVRQLLDYYESSAEDGHPEFAEQFRIRHAEAKEVLTFDQVRAIICLHLPLVPEVVEPFLAANRGTDPPDAETIP